MRGIIFASILISLTVNLLCQDPAWHVDNRKKEPNNFEISPNGDKLLFIDSRTNGHLFVMDLESGEHILEIPSTDEKSIRHSTLSWIDNRTFSYARTDQTVVVYDMDSQSSEEKTFPHFIFGMHYVSDGYHIISSNIDSKSRYAVYHFEEDSIYSTTLTNSEFFPYYNISPDGKSVITSGLVEVFSNRMTWELRKLSIPTLNEEALTSDSLRARPNVMQFRENGSFIAVNQTTIDTTINGNMGSYFFTEVIEYDENFEQISYDLSLKYGHYLGIDGSNLIFKNERSKKIEYIKMPEMTVVDSIDLDFNQSPVFEKDGQRLFHGNGMLSVYNNNLELQREIPLFKGNAINSSIFDLDNLDESNFLVSTGYGFIKMFNSSSGSFIRDYLKLDGSIRSIEYSEELGILLVGTQSAFYIFDNDNILLDSIHLEVVLDCKFSPSGRYAAISCYNDDLVVYDLEKMELRNRFDAGHWIECVEFIDDDKLAIGHEKDIVVYDIDNEDELYRRQLFSTGYDNKIEDIDLSPNGKYLAISTLWDNLVIMDAQNYSSFEFKGNPDYFRGADWDLSGNYLIAHSTNNTFMYDIENRDLVYKSSKFSENENIGNYEYINGLLVSSNNNYHIYSTQNNRLFAYHNPFGDSSIRQLNEELSIYPNPASEYVIIPSELQGSDFEIRDIEGRLAIGSRANAEIDISRLANGEYFILFKQDDNIFVGKLAVRK